MRKLKLLLTATALLLLGGISVNAQLTSGTVYWIQDTSTGQFLSQGDNWSTRAVTKDVGGLGFEVTYISDGVYTLKNIMMNTVKGSTKGLGSDLYVDNGTPAQFTLTTSGDGYKISLNNNYWVNNGTENAYKEKPLGTTTDAAAATVWKFLTKTEYDAAIQAYKDGKAASYATSLGYSANTVSELEAFILDKNQFISKDYTTSIKNPTLSSNGNDWAHGKVSQRNEGWNVGSGCAEFWNGCGYCTQSVSGLPNGLYKITFVGAYRPDNKSEAQKLVSEKASSPAFVYANDAKIELIHWIDVPAQANGRDGITVANGYQSSFYTYVTDGTLALGVVADGWTAASGNNCYSWTTFGQFTLTYYTDQVSNEDATAILNTANGKLESKMGSGVKSALTSAISTFDANRTIANFNALNTAISNAQASIDSYVTLQTAITNANNNTIYKVAFEGNVSAYTTAVSVAQGVYDAAEVDDCAAAITALTNGIHSVYESDYSIFANDYPYDYSSLLNQDMTKWTSTDYVTMTANEHWNGLTDQRYYEQSGAEWGKSSWSHAASETTVLPAGKYVMSITARASSDVTSSMSVKVGDNDAVNVSLPNKGASGRGITTDGVGSFSDGTYANTNGRGWEYRFIAFELAEESPVTISFSSSTNKQYNWVSIAAPLLKGDVHPNQIELNQIHALVETLEGYESEITATTYATFADHITAANGATVDSEDLEEIITNLQADIETAKEEAAIVTAYNTAKAAAEAYQDDDMFDSDKNDLNTAISNNTLDITGTVTAEQITTATSNLNTAATNAAKNVIRYTTYNNATTAINGGTEVDLTSFIGNPGFESSEAFTLVGDGWINEGVGIQGQNNGGFGANQVGEMFAERWDGTKIGAFKTYQVIDALPAGIYEISVVATFNGEGASLLVNGVTQPITDAATYKLMTKIEDKGSIELGVQAVNPTGSWFVCDDFHMTYIGADFPAYTLVTGNMNADVAAAQTAADEAFKANKTVANYDALTAAIAAAQASKDAYVPFTVAINKIDAALVAATTATASPDDYNAIKTAYNDGTIADNEIQTSIKNAYDAVIPVIKSQTATSADFTFAIQNQSFEYGDMTGWIVEASSDTGVRDVSNPSYAATGYDGNYLFNTWWKGNPITQTVANLPNGQYTLTASVASDGATIYLIANGEHNEGTETGGTYPGKDTFQEATIIFLVKDGTATIGAVGGVDGTAGEHKDYVAEGYWWYKADNFRLQKNRNLTPEEEAVVPTAIALYNGEIEVTEPIALNATNNSVSLTVAYTPNDATEGVTWESSDETVATVADGVVTGVAPGTATITATSTLDANVSATATVTVTYPETEVAASTYVNNGATRTVYTLGENLIKNGSFEYPDAYYGWTVGTGAKMTSSQFTIEEDNGDNYIQSVLHNGSNAAGSLRQAWPIEAGKKYLFGYKVKNVSGNQQNNNSWFRVSLCNANPTNGDGTIIEQYPSYNGEWTDYSVIVDNTETEFTFVQAHFRWLGEKGEHTAFDDFYLQEITGEDVVGNVDYATAAIPTANIGTGAFQYSQDAIDAANALVQGTATVEDVENAYTALTTINEPADDKLFNVILTYGGWDYDQKAMTYLAGDRNDHGGYNIKYQAAANTNLAQAFTFTKVSGNNYKMSQIDANGVARYICTVTGGGYANNNKSGIRTTTDASKALVVTVIPTATEGKWNLRNTEANNYIGSQDAGVYTVNSHIDFNIAETSKPSITINTTAAGYGTTMLPFAVASLPQDVNAYTCAEVDGEILTLEGVNALEANKPYIIEGEWNETLTGDAQGTALTYTQGLLTGVYAATEAPVGSYVMQKNNGKVGFYKVAEGKQPTVGANRCYLTVPAAAREAFFFDNDTNGISTVEALTSGDAEIYNAAGARIPTLQKGMNILKRNGKSYKVIVK